MAVKRVFGTVDGTEVALTYGAEGMWSVPVPFDVNGEYVVEIIAEDEARNQTYMARMMFCVESSMLCAHIVLIPYCAELIGKEYEAEYLPPQYYAELLKPQYSWRGDG